MYTCTYRTSLIASLYKTCFDNKEGYSKTDDNNKLKVNLISTDNTYMYQIVATHNNFTIITRTT